MANNFDNPYSANVIGLWEFDKGFENEDSGLGDGVAQNGTPINAPEFAGGWLLTTGSSSFFKINDGHDQEFDLTEGTIVTQFMHSGSQDGQPDTVVSRGKADTDGNGDVNDLFEIRVTDKGAVEVLHANNGNTVLLSTDIGFAGAQNIIEVTYSWHADGVKVKVHNMTDDSVVNAFDDQSGMTLDLTNGEQDSFVIGARQNDDCDYDQHFDGGVNFVAVLDAPVLSLGDGIVDGSSDADLIDLAYLGDPEGDRIDNGDAILPGEAPDDDIVDAGAGNDTVEGGLGSDEIYGGGGSDNLSGQAGDDVIYGDANAPGGDADSAAREAFLWNEVTTQGDGVTFSDQDDLTAGFTQNTGSVDVAFSTLYQASGVDTEFNDQTQLVGDINSGGSAVNPKSALHSVLNGSGNFAAYELDFSQDVENVSFRINDIDGDGVVKVVAYDADGNPIDVTLSDPAKVTLFDNDGLNGAETADSDGGYGDPDDADYSVLVTIPGPVSRLVIKHTQDGTNNSGIDVTDVYFDVPLPLPAEEGDDTLAGGDGDDVLYGEGGDDLLLGGDGQDTLLGGDDSDIIGAGVGDVIEGGEGGVDLDTLIAEGLATIEWDGNDPTTEAGTVTFYNPDLSVSGTARFSEIEDAYIISTGPAPAPAPGGPGTTSVNGVVEGTDGDDIIDLGYLGDPEGDLVDGDDAVLPLEDEEDIILAGAGNDRAEGHDDGDIIFGQDGDDTLLGMDGNDGLSGGAGDDSLDGGEGRDIMVGGDGDDLLSGSNQNDEDGGDIMFGGQGDDTFVNVGQGELIAGGEDDDGADIDTLDLTGAADAVNPGGSLTVTLDDTNPENGVVTFFDAFGDETGTTVFSEIENIIVPCFTPGTLIATPKGERRVEDLQVGDRVITRDNGIQEIRWVGSRDLKGTDLKRASHLNPVRIAKGALSNGLPERDMLVSPNHRVLVASDKTALYFEDREVLVAAKHLTGLDGVETVEVPWVTYIHFMFDQHEVILSDGAWSESFQPGDQTLDGLGNAQRNEIFELFPELKTQEGREGYHAARRSLKKHEANLLTH
jgi:Hint domain-containing protein/hemolysin type calcium-binding protein